MNKNNKTVGWPSSQYKSSLLAKPLKHVFLKQKKDISNNKVYECQTKDDIS